MDSVALIKEKIDLIEFLRQYVNLVAAGKNMKALCPFHKEKTPSFIVSPDRGVWHCFGCGAGGDLISFVMRYENIEFFEALKILAERAGIDLKQFGGQDAKQFAVLYEINNAAKEFFCAALRAQAAPAASARAYLADRGLTTATIEAFELGFAASAADALTRHLTKLGHRIQDVERAGLTIKTERGTYWDRFRGRIMFPLHNHFGKVVAFTGRILPIHDGEGIGKYVNSPETPIFSKSRLLFGFHASKNFIRETNAAVLVEGQMDFLMSWQDGVKNIVASSGTALTADHVKSLRRFADTLIVSFDDDEAGQAAGERAIDLAAAADFVVRVLPPIPISGAKDPADAVRAKPGLMASLVKDARPAMQFYFDRYLKGPLAEARGRRDMEQLKRGLRVVLQKMARMASAVERGHWLTELAAQTGIAEHFLMDEMVSFRESPQKVNTAGIQTPAVPATHSRHELVAKRLVGLALGRDEFKGSLLEAAAYLPGGYREVFEGETGGATAQTSEMLADDVVLRASLADAHTATKEEFADLLHQLKREYFRGEQVRIRDAIRRYEAEADEGGLRHALAEFDRVAKEMNNA